MRNSILIFLLIIFPGPIVKAQESVILGAKAGVNFTNMKSDHFSDHKSRTGYLLGLLAEIPIANRFSIQPEILYSTQGSEVKEILLGGGPIITEIKLDYIQVPLLAKVYLTKSLSVEAGPSFNFLVNEEIGGEETEFGSNFEFSGAVGASYKIIEGFLVNARYNHGFTNAFDSEFDTVSIKNYGFQMGIGLILL